MQASHVVSETPILYLGTPVVMISTCNEDSSVNLAPMSSAFWLGWRALLGLDASSKTSENLLRTGECVLNLPSADGVAGVDRLARLTGTNPVPRHKAQRGYSYEKHKFAAAGLSEAASQTVAPPRVLECPVQLEAVVASVHGLMEDDLERRGTILAFELRVQRVHAHPTILMNGDPNRIDPDKWRPLIMSFQRFYGLTSAQIHPSKLGQIPESAYRSSDVARARVPNQN